MKTFKVLIMCIDGDRVHLWDVYVQASSKPAVIMQVINHPSVQPLCERAQMGEIEVTAQNITEIFTKAELN